MTAALPSSLLDQKLLQLVSPLDVEIKRSILLSAWGIQLSNDDYTNKAQRWNAYFRHYEEQCEQLSPGGISTLTHRQILDVVALMKCKTRVECSNDLLKVLNQLAPPAIEDAINFAANAVLLLNVSRWQGVEHLREFMRSHFGPTTAGSEKSNLPKSFNAKTLADVAGIKVHWTNDITQHLQMRNDDTEVALFHHVSVLDLYKTSAIDIIPEEVLEETRKTLSLLLPRPTKKWFKKQEQKLQKKSWVRKQESRLYLDPKAGVAEHLRADERCLENFSYWRDRLIILKDTYDDHEPRGIKQFWRDDRNSVQWWTFWIALLVFLFAIVQCIEGALQVYKAYHPSPS